MDAILWTLSQEEERRKQEESEARKSSHEREHKPEEVPPFRFITVQSSGSDTPLPPPPKEVSTSRTTTTSSMTHCLYDDMSEGESGADDAAADETAGAGREMKAVTRSRRWSRRSSCSACSVDEELLLLQQSCTENWLLDFFNHICCVSSTQLQLEDEESGSKHSAGHRHYNRRSSIEV